MPVEVFALGADAHGVDAQADLPKELLRVEVLPGVIVGVEFFFAEFVEV